MIKKGKNILRGFTLIEILVVISIIAILAIGTSNINWNRLTDRQKVTIFQNKVISELETIRNNALFGKGVGTNLIVPDQWSIDIGSGSIHVGHTTDGIFTQYSTGSFDSFERISNINCGGNIYDTGSILIEGINMSLTGSCTSGNILNFDVEYKSFTGTIEINSVSGLIGSK